MVSWCEPPENLLGYPSWYLCRGGRCGLWRVRDGRAHGKGVAAWLEGCEDRDRAQALAGATVAVRRAELPEPGEGEYYWADLIGLTVVSAAGQELGRVAALIQHILIGLTHGVGDGAITYRPTVNEERLPIRLRTSHGRQS